MAEEIKFKSVGQTMSDRTELQESTEASRPPIGIKTPLRLGGRGEAIFAMHTSLVDQLEDNLRNLIQTNHGERLGMFNFGANLHPLMTEITAREDFETEAMARITTAVNRFMPFVNLRTFSSEIQHDENQVVGMIVLTVGYDIERIGVRNRQMQVILNVV